MVFATNWQEGNVVEIFELCRLSEQKTSVNNFKKVKSATFEACFL